MRILVDIPEQQVKELGLLAKQGGKPRAEVIREAVSSYLAEHQVPISAYFGIWADNPETQDVQAYLDKIRGEWER